MGKEIFCVSAIALALTGIVPAGSVHAQQATIQTSVASWGYGGERKNVKDDVAKLCDGKPSCTFMVKNETFPTGQPADPSPGNDKGVVVVWKCGDAQHKEQFAEGKNAKMDCSAP